MSKSSRTRVPAYSRQSCGVPTRRRLVRSARADRSFVVAGGERVRRLRAAAVGRVGVLSRATASPEHPTTTQRCMPIVNELLIQPQRIGLNSNTNTSAGNSLRERNEIYKEIQRTLRIFIEFGGTKRRPWIRIAKELECTARDSCRLPMGSE